MQDPFDFQVARPLLPSEADLSSSSSSPLSTCVVFAGKSKKRVAKSRERERDEQYPQRNSCNIAGLDPGWTSPHSTMNTSSTRAPRRDSPRSDARRLGTSSSASRPSQTHPPELLPTLRAHPWQSPPSAVSPPQIGAGRQRAMRCVLGAEFAGLLSAAELLLCGWPPVKIPSPHAHGPHLKVWAAPLTTVEHSRQDTSLRQRNQPIRDRSFLLFKFCAC